MQIEFETILDGSKWKTSFKKKEDKSDKEEKDES